MCEKIVQLKNKLILLSAAKVLTKNQYLGICKMILEKESPDNILEAKLLKSCALEKDWWEELVNDYRNN